MEVLPIDQLVSIYEYETCRFKETFLSFQPQNVFLEKSRVRQMSEGSGALNTRDYDGKFFLKLFSAPEYNSLDITISECNKYCFGETTQRKLQYTFLSEYEIVRFTTEDKTIDFISNKNFKRVDFVATVGERHTLFLSDHYNYIENEGIEEETLINSINKSFDPYDYDVINCGENAFTQLVCE